MVNLLPTSLSTLFIFSARKFLPDALWNEKTSAEFGARFLELIFGASFWHVCHGPYSCNRICLQKTVTREPRIGEECTDRNEPKNNVYGEKYPVNYSVAVSINQPRFL